MFELHHLTAREQVDWLRRREITPTELVTHYLERIERLDGDLGAFTTVTAERALDRAAAMIDPTAAPLWGLPLGDKDLERRAGVRTTFGSRVFADLVPSAIVDTEPGSRDALYALERSLSASSDFTGLSAGLHTIARLDLTSATSDPGGKSATL